MSEPTLGSGAPGLRSRPHGRPNQIHAGNNDARPIILASPAAHVGGDKLAARPRNYATHSKY
ncbi:hypothetical protein KFU94_13440 [Chloroflexi bacterium TSY]|nr:hypothetical protein [Chloroflexi bacterium TSY]